MSSLDYLDLCRLCLVKERVSVPIFEGEGDVRQIFLKIAACLPVKVNREDKLPKKICDDCVYKVELLYQFWNTTVNAEKQLLQWLGETGLEENKQQSYSNVLNPNVMKQEQSGGNRLDGSMMQQVSSHQNNMSMGIIDNIGLTMPMMMPTTSQQQQITSVPMDTSGSSVQAVQEMPSTSTQAAHEQITQSQPNAATQQQQEEEEESSEDDENSDDECDPDEGLPVKEENEEDPNNSRAIEPTTFVNVSLACDEAGPSGLQQQKIPEMPEMTMPQNTDGDSKSGTSDPLNVEARSFPEERAHCTSKGFDSNNEHNHETSEFPRNNVDSEEKHLNEATDSRRSSKRRAEKFVECEHCSRRFMKKSNLAEHLKQHKHKCADCPKTFSLQRYLLTHIERIHRRRVYECSMCDYKSNNKDTLKNHYIRLHTSGYDYSCDTCGKQFKIKKALNHHVKQNHSGAPPIVCDVCGHFSKNLHALKAHMKYRHYKPEFVCGICRRGMTTRENLEQHLAWHETREKVLCPTCGKKFRGRDLDSHMRVHTGVKPFPCPVCGKTFRRQTAQEQHLLIHTGKRPYVCDICGQAFAQKPGLICHRKRHPGPLPPLPVVSVKSIVTEFTKQYATKNTIIKIE